MEQKKFNFFLPPALKKSFQERCKQKRVPMGVYLRSLVEKEMEEDNNWQIEYDRGKQR